MYFGFVLIKTLMLIELLKILLFIIKIIKTDVKPRTICVMSSTYKKLSNHSVN